MSRNNRKNRDRRIQDRLARHSPALVHPASRPPVASGPSDDFRPLVYRPPVRTPLIRTVLEIPAPPPPPRRSTPRSPVLSARATGRSSDRKARSPFFTATGITPELTNRAIVCAGRTIRREVLFARKQTGKGSKSPRRYRSKVKC